MKYTYRQKNTTILSPYFKADDTIEFDDGTDAYMSINFDKDKLTDIFTRLKLKIVKDRVEIKIGKLPFKASKLVFQCLLSFFTDMNRLSMLLKHLMN